MENRGTLVVKKMEQSQTITSSNDDSPLERLADIADAIFDRANQLDGIKLGKNDGEAAQTIAQLRDEGFEAVIAVWRVIHDMLPTSNLNHALRKELTIDGYKVISRCSHRLEQYEEAALAITQAINLGYLDGFISLGAIRMDTRNYEEAEEAFKTAIAKGAQAMRAYAGLGELYFILGANALKEGDQNHVQYFEKSEEAFLAAGKERFHESYERAMDLFAAIGWKDRAISFGEKAVQYYANNRLRYGDKLRSLDARMRKLTGEERYERLLTDLGRKLGNIVGGRKTDDKV